MSRVSSDPSSPTSAKRRRRPWLGYTLRWGIGVGAAVIAFNALFSRRDELSGAVTILAGMNPLYVAFAVVAEVASIGAYAALTRRLLQAGGLDIGLATLTAVTLAANAIQNSLPVGPAWSTVYAYRQFRRRGADPVLAGWTLVIQVLIAFAALGLLALVGLVASQGQAASLDLVRVLIGVGIVIVGLAVAARRGLVSLPGRRPVIWLVRASQRLVRRPRGDATEVVNRAFDRLGAVHLSKWVLASAACWAMANWLLDLTCLALAFAAVRTEIPWRGLLLAYGAGQLAANLPITLGGLGVVEGSLTVALVFYGGAEMETVAAVLLYRIISFWMMLPIGWTSALVIRLRSRHLEEVAG